MSEVVSKDGTRIAFDRQGSGPAVVLVGGGLADRSENAPLAAELARHFTVYNYDRRGRGLSGDTRPYALERELEDLEALIAGVGGPVHLYGVSSGGALALEAAAAADAIAASMPHAERKVIPVQSHIADPTVVAPILEQFFTSTSPA